MRFRLAGILALLAASLALMRPADAGLDEAYRKPQSDRSWGDLLTDFVGYRGFGRSYALIVGISGFKGYPDLPTPNDPIRMRDFLVDEAGYDYVHVLTDDKATKARIDELMVDVLPAMMGANDQFLFYWSGHGEQRPNALGGQVGYLPVADSLKDRYSTMVSMGDIQRWDALLEAKQALFLLDACFSGLAGTVSQSGHRDLQIAQLAQPAHQLVTAGTGEQQTIAGDRWGGSVFTDAVLRAVRGEADAETSYGRDGVVSFSELIGYVKTRVAAEANAAGWSEPITPQPRDLRASTGEFFFLTSEHKVAKLRDAGGEFQQRFEGGMPVVIMGEAPAPACDREADRLFWDAIKNETAPGYFEAYLKRVESGELCGLFADIARLRLEARVAAPSAAHPAPAQPSDPAAPDPAAAEAALDLTAEDRTVVEEALAALGFDPGGIDDVFGADTRRAILRWQQAKGEEPTGHLTATQHGRLLAEAEPKLAALPSAPEAPLSGVPAPTEQRGTSEPGIVFNSIRRAIAADLAHYDPFPTTFELSDHLPGALAPALSVVEPEVRFAGAQRLQVAGHVALEDLDLGHVTAAVTPRAEDLLAVEVRFDGIPGDVAGCAVDFEQRTFDLAWNSVIAAFTGLRAAFSPIEIACPDLSLAASDFRIDSATTQGGDGLWSGHLEVALQGLVVAEGSGNDLLRTDAAAVRMTFDGFDLAERARLLAPLPGHYWPRRVALLGAPFDLVAADLGVLPGNPAELYAASGSSVDLSATLRGLRTTVDATDIALANAAIEIRSTPPAGLSYRHDGLSVHSTDVSLPADFALDLQLGQADARSMLAALSAVDDLEWALLDLLERIGPLALRMQGASRQGSAEGTGKLWVEPGGSAPSAAITLTSDDPSAFLLETFFRGLAQKGDPAALRRAVEDTVRRVARVARGAAGERYRFDIEADFANERVVINGVDMNEVGALFDKACTQNGC